MTVTSNIHVGLPGWSNTTYAVGQRRSNAGNAYQVITAGTSTSPPTGTGSNITPGGTSAWKWLSAIDYSTLQAWADSIPTTLTQPIVGLVWNDTVITATAGTAILTLSGHTTSSTNTITLAPATGEGFLATFQAAPTTPYRYNNANGVSIEFPSSGFGGINYIQIDDNNVIFRGMQVKDLNASSGATMIGGLGAIWLDKCLIEGQSQPSGARMLQMGAASIKITNSLIIDNSIGNPDSATIEATGTGCAIAYTTIVKTSPATGSAALDAHANSTTASNTVIGCIFVGYDTPLIAIGGQPWTTNHNAYTNSSFTSIAATDTGGSVFSADPSSLFVSFTSADSFSSEFSSSFGSGSGLAPDYHQNPTSPSLNAGVTDTTDIPTADDTFGISRPQGASWDIGPHELLAGGVISRDFIVPGAFSQTVVRSVAAPSNWNYSFARNMQLQMEWRQAAIFNSAFPSENKISFPFFVSPSPFSSDFSSDFGGGSTTWTYDPQTAVEFRSQVPQITRDVSVPLEWRVTVAADRPIASDLRASAQLDIGQGIEWRANKSLDSVIQSAFSRSVNRDIVTPADGNYGLSGIIGSGLEWRQTGTFDTYILIENKVSFPYLSLPDPFSNDFPPDFGGGSSWIYDPQTPIEFQSITPHALRDVSFPLEWAVTTSADWPVAHDWLASITQSALSSTEFAGSARADTLSSVGWKSTSSADNVLSVEAKGGIARDAVHYIDRMAAFILNIGIPADFVISVINTVPASAEFTQATALTITVGCDPYLLVLADKIVALEQSASRSVNVPMPTEIGGGTGVGIPADSIIALEWRGGIMADASIGVSASVSVKSDLIASVSSDALRIVDYALGSAFGGTPMITIIAPSEWGHLTLGMAVDMASVLEIQATVHVDMLVPSNRLVGRKSVGSQLEPDEWEEENEPSC